MGFSIKLAPGVRIRASSRGVRASLGPRAARVHIGGGRAGFSTGAGPVSLYTSLGGRRRTSGRGAGSPGISAGNYQRQFAAQRALATRGMGFAEFLAVVTAFERILRAHHAEFPPATRPVAPAPTPPDWDAIYLRYEREALAGIGIFQRTERAQARQRAAALTEAEVARQEAEAAEQQARVQEYLDRRWEQLCANVPEVVIETLEEAFEDNESPSAAVGVDRDEVSLVVLVPPLEDVVPQDWPVAAQPGGAVSLRRLSPQDRASYYALFVCAQLLVTVREAMAVAPSIASARVAVIRKDRIDAYGRPRVSCLLAAKFERSALDGVKWDSVDAATIVDDVATECINNLRGTERRLVDLAAEPALRALIDAADLD
jgi:hypothetical protein